ncbi:MAG TPA: pyruvate, phosphate dikinase [Actinomycetota bacterium]|nr:pyruvate, phosphate dikinase [Actinomycetota bacterium]
MTKYVYDFPEGNKDMKDLLGGKGANLAEMTNMGLTVPHGFTITTEACLAYLAEGGFPDGLVGEVEQHVESLESSMGKRLGDPNDPLLVSVRSGAKFSMPGMMDTVLNLGLNEASLKGLAEQSGGDIRFARDAYRRFIQMFGKIVMDVPGDAFERALDAAKERKGEGATDTDLGADDLEQLTAEFLGTYREHTGQDFPIDPREQMRLAIEAVFKSWNGKRAIDYRRQNKISDSLGTAVNVQSMVFGNRGDDSGTGVAFTRDPSTGEKVPYGDYLGNAQGEDVVAGIRNTLPLAELERVDADSYAGLREVMATLEQHYRDMCDIEFTIEKGRLWILQTRVGKRTAFGEWVMAHDMLEEGLIDEREALLRVDANRLEELFKRRIDAAAAERETPIAKGLNASPGAAIGAVVFTADEAQARGQAGEKVILVRRETTPDDYHGMIAAQGILTSAGGTNSHAAVVARGEGIPAVCGADAIKLRVAEGEFAANGTKVREGETITIDGFTGDVFVGELPLEESLLEKARQGDATARAEPLWRAFERIMRVADDRRALRVRANADTPEQSTNARERGAEGIGLCRTEHMFLGEERVMAVRQMIFADTSDEERSAYEILLPLQRNDFVGIFTAMSGLPVTVRLLDPPLHEFLPDQVELAVEVALAAAKGDDVTQQERVLQKVNELHEMNPMLGLRGVRLGIVKPGLYAMQVRAIVEAAVEVLKAGGDPKVEIMIPLVATAPELAQMRAELEPVATEILEREGVELSHLEWGTMIELPRAAVTAGEIAESAEFFSFGTNDLTQTAFGFSRDDIGKFVGMYEERKLVPANPFVTIDQPGVGVLMRTAVEQGTAANPTLHLGICGEHGGDPASVVFCHELGLDYVSCSPFRVETARLAAGQAAAGRAEVASR